MTAIDLFALVVLIVLALAGLAGWVALGVLPGWIARKRNHPQAEAISMCGWWGAVTLGILSPLAFVWAYTRPCGIPGGTSRPSDQAPPDES